MRIRYQRPGEDRQSGTSGSIEQQGQHMTFQVAGRDFDAYLFSWDHNKMAGSYASGGRRFGFYAVKQ